GVNLTLAQGSEIVGYRFFFVEAHVAGVGADKPLIEDAPGKLVKLFLLQRAQHASADFRGVGNGLKLNPALLALSAKFFPENAQNSQLRRAVLSLHPHQDGLIIGEGGLICQSTSVRLPARAFGRLLTQGDAELRFTGFVWVVEG